tara:strand:- start:1237 stop:1449 length:213 start_codon:yes stop_codon:yes gene_type:complete
MKIPKKMLFEMVMSGKLQRYDEDKDRWIKVSFEEGNEDHIHLKSMHYAQAEIDFVYEAMQMGVTIFRDLN